MQTMLKSNKQDVLIHICTLLMCYKFFYEQVTFLTRNHNFRVIKKKKKEKKKD